MLAMRSIIPLLALASLSYGNLLENEKQLEKRYGPPIAATEELRRTYRWGEYIVEVRLMPGFDSGFMRGRSTEEKIYREDRKLLGIRDLRTILPQPPWQSQSETLWTHIDKTARRTATLVGEKMLVFDWEPSQKMKEALLKAVD